MGEWNRSGLQINKKWTRKTKKGNVLLKYTPLGLCYPKHAGRPKKPYTEKAQSKAIRVIGSIADQVKTINDFIREHPYEEDRVKFLLSSVIEQLK